MYLIKRLDELKDINTWVQTTDHMEILLHNQVHRKCQHHINLKRLRNIDVDRTTLSLFCESVVKTVLCFSIFIWYGKLTRKEKNKIKKTVKTAGRRQAKTAPLD